MKKFLPFLIIAVILVILLNRGYARIYEHNGQFPVSPYLQNTFNFKNQNFQNTVKYVALGDSLSSGIGSFKQEETLPYIFSQKLSQKMSVNMINLAEPGATSKDLINSQLAEAVAEKPNYITLFIGTNDLHDQVSDENFQQNLNLILDKLSQKTSAKIIVFNLPYLGADSLILPPLSVYFDLRTQQFNHIIAQECQNRSLTLIDLYTPTKNIFSKESDFYSIDQFHPSGKGYILWGSLLDESSY